MESVTKGSIGQAPSRHTTREANKGLTQAQRAVLNDPCSTLADIAKAMGENSEITKADVRSPKTRAEIWALIQQGVRLRQQPHETEAAALSRLTRPTWQGGDSEIAGAVDCYNETAPDPVIRPGY